MTGRAGKTITRQRIWRHEEKYLLNEVGFMNLYWQLRPLLQLDAHAGLPDWPPGSAPAPAPAPGPGSGSAPGPDTAADAALAPLCQYPGYHVRSLYFDTSERHALFEKLAGVDHRFKYRIRVYDSDDRVIHFEKKMKRSNLCFKESLAISRSQVDALLRGDLDWLLDMGALGQELYADMRTRLMAPLVLVDYHRIPFVGPADEIRITFDRQLSTGLFRTGLFDPAAALQPVLAPGEVILEVKYNHFLPDHLRSLLSGPGLAPVAVSKYAMCCQEITPSAWGDPQDTWQEEWTYTARHPRLSAARERIEWHE